MTPLIEANWNRPLIALAMICITFIAALALYYLANRKW